MADVQVPPTTIVALEEGAVFVLPEGATFFRTGRKPKSETESGPQLRTYIRLVHFSEGHMTPRTDGKDSGVVCYAEEAAPGSKYQVRWTWTNPYAFRTVDRENRRRVIERPRSVGTMLIERVATPAAPTSSAAPA